MRIIILGADGRLSNAVAHAAIAAGHDVTAVTRSGKLRHPVEGVAHRAADALDRAALVAACEGADVVFNGLNAPYDKWAELALPMAENAVAACRAADARMLFPGNVYNFGEAMPEALTADTPQQPTTGKGRIRVETEELFERSGLDVTVLRAGDFYGRSVPGSWFDLMVAKDAAKGAFTYPGPTDRVHAWAYLPDLARAFVALAEADLPGFNCFGFEGHSMTGVEMRKGLEAAIGGPLNTKGVPWWLLRAVGLFNPMLRQVAKMAYLWRVPHRLDGTALEAAIGPVHSTPREVALAEAWADLGEMRSKP